PRFNPTLWTQLKNLVGWSNLRWKPIRRTHYFKYQFIGLLRSEFEVIGFSHADGELSGTEVSLPCRKFCAVFSNWAPGGQQISSTQTNVNRGILRHNVDDSQPIFLAGS